MKSNESIPLRVFAATRPQRDVAVLIGVTQGSVSQMLNSERDIWVRPLPGGRYEAFEIRPVGRKSGEPRAA